MKIDPNMTIGAVTGTRPASRPSGVPGAFEEMLGKAQAAGETTGAMSVPGMATMMPDPSKIKALSSSSEALEMLDAYAQALTDPGQSMHDLQGMINSLSGMKGRLDEAGGALAPDDPLRAILREVSGAIEEQEIRFQRGDLLG